MENEDQGSKNKQILIAVIGIAILVVAVVGVSFAFFNYTRTGPANTISTGQIEFTTSQTVTSVSNLFPVSATDITASTTSNVATTVVTVSGWTNYSGGIDYTISATQVDLKGMPIKVKVFKDGTLTSTATLVSNPVLTTGSDTVLATGHIDSSATAPQTTPSGTITVKAYLDAENIIISDTPADDSELSQQQITDGYDDGTVIPNGYTRVSTDDWNELATNPATFKIKVVAEEHEGS